MDLNSSFARIVTHRLLLYKSKKHVSFVNSAVFLARKLTVVFLSALLHFEEYAFSIDCICCSSCLQDVYPHPNLKGRYALHSIKVSENNLPYWRLLDEVKILICNAQYMSKLKLILVQRIPCAYVVMYLFSFHLTSTWNI